MDTHPISRRRLMLGAGAAVVAPFTLPAAVAQQAPVNPLWTRPGEAPPVEGNVTTLDAWIDVFGRPTAAVRINGRGPYKFLVDTGATTTVIAARHAVDMGLMQTGNLVVNGTTGTAEMPMAVAGEVNAGTVRRLNLRVALIREPGLRKWDGMLGADVFGGRRVVFDIRQKTVRLENSAASRMISRKTANVRLRHGMLAEISGKVGRVNAKLILDTGADSSIANIKLSEALRLRHPTLLRAQHATVTGVTGATITGEAIALPRVMLGNVYAMDTAAVAADAQIFRVWGLENEPAMIVGIDFLSRLASFSIDYGSRVFEANPMAMLLSRGETALG